MNKLLTSLFLIKPLLFYILKIIIAVYFSLCLFGFFLVISLILLSSLYDMKDKLWVLGGVVETIGNKYYAFYLWLKNKWPNLILLLESLSMTGLSVLITLLLSGASNNIDHLHLLTLTSAESNSSVDSNTTESNSSVDSNTTESNSSVDSNSSKEAEADKKKRARCYLFAIEIGQRLCHDDKECAEHFAADIRELYQDLTLQDIITASSDYYNNKLSAEELILKTSDFLTLSAREQALAVECNEYCMKLQKLIGKNSVYSTMMSMAMAEEILRSGDPVTTSIDPLEANLKETSVIMKEELRRKYFLLNKQNWMDFDNNHRKLYKISEVDKRLAMYWADLMCKNVEDPTCALLYKYPYITNVYSKAELTGPIRPANLPEDYPHPLSIEVYERLRKADFICFNNHTHFFCRAYGHLLVLGKAATTLCSECESKLAAQELEEMMQKTKE